MEEKQAIMIKDGRAQLSFVINLRNLQNIRTIEGRKYVISKKVWRIPTTKKNVTSLIKWGFSIDNSLREILKVKDKEYFDEIKKVDEAFDKLGSDLKCELRPFQKKGVLFLEDRGGRTLIGDDMGLGKTAQAIAWFSLHPELLPIVVICPASVKLAWIYEINKWTKGYLISVLSGKKSYNIPNPKKQIYILNYEIIGKKQESKSWLKYLKKLGIKVMIMDECHYIKNHKTIRYKSVKALSENVPHILGLSGTPITNRPIEMFSSLNIIDPVKWPSRWGFAQRYCSLKKGRYGWDFTGASHMEELHEKLTNEKEGIMIRRTKSLVLDELPDKQRVVVPLEIDNRKEYTYAENNLISWIKENEGDKAAARAKMAQALVEIEKLKQLSVEGKMKGILSWIEDFFQNEDKLVVFALHTNTVNRICEHFHRSCVKFTGSSSLKEREFAIKQFQERKDIKLFVGNIKAAGTGINGLQTVCSNSCFVELGWTPGEHDQAEDRLHRINQKEAVTAWYLLGSKTIEEKISTLIDMKRSITKKVLDGESVQDSDLLSSLLGEYTSGG